MSAGDLAVVLITMIGIGTFVVVIVVALSLLRTVRQLRITVERLEADARPLVLELRQTVRQAGAEVGRVDELIDTAAAIQQTVDHASRLTYVAFSNPLIKVVAFFRGIGRGTGRALGGTGRRGRRLRARRAARELQRQNVKRDKKDRRVA